MFATCIFCTTVDMLTIEPLLRDGMRVPACDSHIAILVDIGTSPASQTDIHHLYHFSLSIAVGNVLVPIITWLYRQSLTCDVAIAKYDKRAFT